MASPSQAFLDATRNGNWTTPGGWETMAVQFEGSGLSAATAKAWVDAGIFSHNHALAGIAAGLTPTDAARLRPWLSGLSPLPPIPEISLAAAMLRALSQAGINVANTEARAGLIADLFQEMDDLGIGVGET